MSEDNNTNLPERPNDLPQDDDEIEDQPLEGQHLDGQEKDPSLTEKPKRGRPASVASAIKVAPEGARPEGNKVVKLLDKNPLGMTLPEMAGGPRQIKRIKTMRPQLAEAIRAGLVMPVSQRAGHTVYRLVKHIANR